MSRLRRRGLMGVALVFLCGAVAWRLRSLPQLERIGAGYAAQLTCSCLFVSGRTQESCNGDLEALARKLISTEVRDHAVIATGVLGDRATAQFEVGFGCAPVP